MKITEFYKMLSEHDWAYCYSDCSEVYNRGFANEKRLIDLSKTSEKFEELYNMYSDYVWVGSPMPIIDIKKSFILLKPQLETQEAA